MSGQKLYLHKTDGGAEYLCTGENDIGTAVVRLDGGPALVGNGCMLANAHRLFDALRRLVNTHTGAIWQTAAVQREAWTEAADAIARATGTSA